MQKKFNKFLCVSKKENPKNFDESKKVARDGGSIAGNARIDIENKLKESVISVKNAKELRLNKSKSAIISESKLPKEEV